ncbi:hypothetical protein [Maribellus sediminis]|uniref:hypothetical protein n=1 Tax=Maribellus sediminis TaxID=2696285 RepID=UPI00142F4C28|nr:hypothetical protein [Maribellus sediminis]
MEIKQKIAAKAVFILVALIWACGLNAQDLTKVDNSVFPDTVLVAPNPPKAIKGWEMSEIDGSSVLIGEYPGKILKFQFEGDAVGIAVVGSPESGIIEYSVDNYPWQKQDLFVEEKEGVLELFFTIDSGLKAQKHMLQIRLTDEKNAESAGRKCMLKHFYFNKAE